MSCSRGPNSLKQEKKAVKISFDQWKSMKEIDKKNRNRAMTEDEQEI